MKITTLVKSTTIALTFLVFSTAPVICDEQSAACRQEQAKAEHSKQSMKSHSKSGLNFVKRHKVAIGATAIGTILAVLVYAVGPDQWAYLKAMDSLNISDIKKPVVGEPTDFRSNGVTFTTQGGETVTFGGSFTSLAT